MLIRVRIERHYRNMRSFSVAARQTLAERDIRAALLDAGLPLPSVLTFEEKVERQADMVRRDRGWLKLLRGAMRTAVLARLAQ